MQKAALSSAQPSNKISYAIYSWCVCTHLRYQRTNSHIHTEYNFIHYRHSCSTPVAHTHTTSISLIIMIIVIISVDFVSFRLHFHLKNIHILFLHDLIRSSTKQPFHCDYFNGCFCRRHQRRK